MKRWKIRQRLIYAVQPSISLCHSIYRRQFSKLDRPQHSFHHSHFHYIFDARSICIGFKHAPNTDSVRYSAVYVINVSIVTINDIHWSIYIYWQTASDTEQEETSCVQAYGASRFETSPNVSFLLIHSMLHFCMVFSHFPKTISSHT